MPISSPSLTNHIESFAGRVLSPIIQPLAKLDHLKPSKVNGSKCHSKVDAVLIVDTITENDDVIVSTQEMIEKMVDSTWLIYLLGLTDSGIANSHEFTRMEQKLIFHIAAREGWSKFKLSTKDKDIQNNKPPVAFVQVQNESTQGSIEVNDGIPANTYNGKESKKVKRFTISSKNGNSGVPHSCQIEMLSSASSLKIFRVLVGQEMVIHEITVLLTPSYFQVPMDSRQDWICNVG